MFFLRQSTAVDIAIGPFLDAADGVTPETSLTITQADVRLKKNNGNWAQANEGTNAASEENGWYEKALDATDTNTVGTLLVAITESGALPVWHEFTVLEEAVYDALFAASAPGYLQPTVAGRTLDVSAGGEAGLDWANIGSPTTAQNLSATNIDVDQVVASVTGAVGSVAAGGITAASIATDAIDADAIADNAIDAGAIAANAITAAKIQDGAFTAAKFAAGAFDAVWTVATRTLTSFGTLATDVWAAATRTLTSLAGNAADIRAAVGLASANLDTQLGTIDQNVDDIEALTVATLDAAVSTRATPAQVNAEVVDALAVDTYAEPTGAPPATATLAVKLGRLHQVLRNELTVTASAKSFKNDAGATLWNKALSDDGTTYTEGEGA